MIFETPAMKDVMLVLVLEKKETFKREDIGAKENIKMYEMIFILLIDFDICRIQFCHCKNAVSHLKARRKNRFICWKPILTFPINWGALASVITFQWRYDVFYVYLYWLRYIHFSFRYSLATLYVIFIRLEKMRIYIRVLEDGDNACEKMEMESGGRVRKTAEVVYIYIVLIQFEKLWVLISFTYALFPNTE